MNNKRTAASSYSLAGMLFTMSVICVCFGLIAWDFNTGGTAALVVGGLATLVVAFHSHRYYAAYSSAATVIGVVWYAVLSLPISPATYKFFVKYGPRWPDFLVAISFCVASVLSAMVVRIFLRRTRDELLVMLLGIVLTYLTATFFALFALTVHVFRREQFAGLISELFIFESPYWVGYGLWVATLSFHVAIPTGIVAALLLRWIVSHETQSG